MHASFICTPPIRSHAAKPGIRVVCDPFHLGMLILIAAMRSGKALQPEEVIHKRNSVVLAITAWADRNGIDFTLDSRTRQRSADRSCRIALQDANQAALIANLDAELARLVAQAIR